MTLDPVRIDKLRKRAKHIATQAHLDKIMESFPEEHRAGLLEEIRPHLKFTTAEKNDGSAPRQTQQFNI